MSLDHKTIVQIIDQRLRYLYTTMYGRVTTIDKDTQRVSVQPLQRCPKPTADNEDVVYADLNELHDVPLAFTRTARASGIFKVEPGDFVELRASMFSIDELLTTDVNGPVDPALVGMHDVNDCVAVPVSFGRRPSTSTDADAELIGDNVRLGRPNAAKALVTDDGTASGTQQQMDAFTDRIEAAIASAVGIAQANAAALYVPLPSPPAPTPTPVVVTITPPTIPHTAHVKGS